MFLDLGIHLFNLSYFLINKTPDSVLCDVQKINNLVTDSKILVNYKMKTKGLIWISKSSLGCRNDLRIELFFEKCKRLCGIMRIMSQFLLIIQMVLKKIDRSVQSKLFNQNRYNRYRMGHPSGFIEAFANMYEDIAKDFIKKKKSICF